VNVGFRAFHEGRGAGKTDPLGGHDLVNNKKIVSKKDKNFDCGYVMRRFDKYTAQTLGFALILIGILLIILDLLGGGYQSCPLLSPAYPSCPSPWYWWIPGASFISGIGLIIVGIILLILARRLKPKPTTDMAGGLSEMNA
jgi:hypothetical protein